MNALQITIVGVEHLKRPIWPETEDGSVYRQLLIQELEIAPGFTGRIFPDFHVVQNTFKTAQDVRTFLRNQKVLLADMMGKAKEYYQKDDGCSIEVLVLLEEGAQREIEIVDVNRPKAYEFK